MLKVIQKMLLGLLLNLFAHKEFGSNTVYDTQPIVNQLGVRTSRYTLAVLS